MKRGWVLAIIALFLVVVAVEFMVIVALMMSRHDMAFFTRKSSVVVIRVDDVIYDARKFTDRMELYEDRDDVKAFVFRMETPGGTVAASQELANALARLRSSGKIVVTSIGNIGASGGYYMASQSDVIVVNPGSLVGSIGVIMEHMEVSELIGKLGIRFDAITSGSMKEVGTITRPMRPDERALIQGVIDDAYAQFRSTVLEARRPAIAAAYDLDAGDTPGIERALDAVADGRILTGAQALDCGLADEEGDLKDAIRIAAERAGIKDEPEVIWDNPENPWSELGKVFGLAQSLARHDVAAFLPPPGLWYLYR